MDQIAAVLTERPPVLADPRERTPAAVALILRTGFRGLEVLFVLRAVHKDDPWSGDIGFPGGKVEPFEREAPRLAAQRETREEVGIDLEGARCLGRLDDLTGAHLPINVSCFVYHLQSDIELRLNHEIADAFWFPLVELFDPRRHHSAEVRFNGSIFKRPAIRLLEPGKTVLWGITYRLVTQFMERLGESGGKV